MKKKVLIISGGISKERLISLDTGLQVAKELKRNAYKVKISGSDKQEVMKRDDLIKNMLASNKLPLN